jgi:hypothetical protein
MVEIPLDAVEPDLSKWDAWEPAEVARRLARVAAPWYVAGGWAIDLFLGTRRREHEDTEIAVPQERFDEVARALAGHDLFVVGSGRVWPLEGARETLAGTHQTWVRERGSGLWRLDVFREPSAGGLWVCRRDERIRLRYDELIARTADGIPYARPEIALLFKAKHTLAKDEGDLDAVLPKLARERRRRFAEYLALVHPGHAWLGRLDG